MIIVQISDTHIDPESPNAEARIGDLRAVVDAINALDLKPDLVIHTGDIAHNGDDAKYRIASEILGGLTCRLQVAAGNRDDAALMPNYFRTGRDLMPGTSFLQYSIDDLPVRAIALDTTSAHGNQGDYCEARAESLRRALDESDRPTVLFMHHPPFEITTSDYPQQFKPWDGAERIAGIIEGRRNVVRGFCGHAHRDFPGAVAGVPFSTMPSVARDLRLGEFSGELAGATLFQLHRIDESGRVTSETRAAGRA